MKDRNGRELKPGDRCYRFSRDGLKLRQQVVVKELDEAADTVVTEGLGNLQRGVCRPGQLQRVGKHTSVDEDTAKVVKYKRDKGVVEEAARLARKRKKGARR